jgi:monodechloroaminopyrrolnitrin synthase
MTAELQYPVALGDRHTADLDPVGLDDLLPALWEMNAAGDVRALVSALRRRVPPAGLLSGLSAAGSVAVMRDLGMLLGSVKRCGVEPVAAVPELQAPLLELGQRAGMVPRDTVFHYISWNPAGRRERMYTGHHMERMLMSSVRMTLPRLAAAIEECRRCHEQEPQDLGFALAASELAALTRSLEDAIDTVTDNVTPEFFAQTLRPYFEEIRVAGTDYLGPAAAHAPVYLLDLALWASDDASDSYAELWRESARYALPAWRDLTVAWAGRPSLATRVKSALIRAGDGTPPKYLRASALAVSRALRALMVFRGKHLAIARRAYASDIRLYQLGSGGGSVELLKEITELTRQNAMILRASAGHAGAAHAKGAALAGKAPCAAAGGAGGACLAGRARQRHEDCHRRRGRRRPGGGAQPARRRVHPH